MVRILQGSTFDESVARSFRFRWSHRCFTKLVRQNKTITKTNNGTYFIKDTFTEINDGAAQTSGTASDSQSSRLSLQLMRFK